MKDKSEWGQGPWQDEPDRKEWRDKETGAPCIANRNGMGAWCGYVAVPPGHPLHGKHYDAPETSDLRVHGGLTYANACNKHICHVPEPGEPDNVWWLGFDCGHAYDLVPGLVSYRMDDGEYRTLEYVEAECAKLAKQIAEAGK